ncbi:MAG: hypothetical protein ABI591_27000 [Kofleriaceae bacterium]
MRPWYVIPAFGLASAATAFAVDHQIWVALALGLCGAALAAAIRGFLGPTAVAAVAAAGGAALGVLGLIALAPHGALREALAGAAGLFAISELARAKQPNASPLPAIGAALLAGALDPSYVGLVAVSGFAWLRAPVARPRAAFAVPIAGILATVVACACALVYARTSLWHAWLGHATYPRALAATLTRTGDLVGPMTAFAALVGLVICLAHNRLAAAAIASVFVLTAIASLAGGFVAPAAPLVAALGAGVAIGRLAALVRWPVGQAFVGATAGFVLVVVPAWALIVPA